MQNEVAIRSDITFVSKQLCVLFIDNTLACTNLCLRVIMCPTMHHTYQ